MKFLIAFTFAALSFGQGEKNAMPVKDALKQADQIKTIEEKAAAAPKAVEDKPALMKPSKAAKKEVAHVDKDGIKRVFTGMGPALETCYTTALTQDPKMAGGTLSVDMLINDKGQVKQASTSKGLSSNKNLSDCVLGKVKGATFPAAPKGEEVSISYPLSFSRK